MKTARCLTILLCTFFLVIPAVSIAKGGGGYMGGNGTVVAEEPSIETDSSGEESDGLPDSVEGPLNDKKSDSGKLFGDLYKILRQQGVAGDKKLVPEVNAAGEPVLTGGVQLFVVKENTAATPDAVVGGEPVLTVIDPGDVNNFSDYGWYAADTDDDGIGDTAAQSPFPAQCVQPVASYERWGDISSRTGLTKNRLPMTISYDATWGRSECEVGQLDGGVTVDNNGVLSIPVNQWFIEPGDTWTDPNNGQVTYPDGVLWTALIGEVHFGRLNLSRSPEAVLQSAFDEAINNINSPDTIAIEIDAAGRLLLTKNVYDELLVDSATGLPKLVGTVQKAIDSPLENVALYVKLMQDGHLVTPGDERMPIDRSKNGGIPLWKMLEMTDGPAAAALRPTVNIAKLESFGLGTLVNVTAVEYLTYYICLNDAGTVVPCQVWDEDPVQPEIDRELVGNPAAVSRELRTQLASEGCPVSTFVDNPYVCEGPFTGIMSDDDGTADTADLNFAASFLAAAADKTGDIGVDMVVYLNSILGINKVLGYSAYNDDGSPVSDAIDYEKNPVYFNFQGITAYNRNTTFGSGARGRAPADWWENPSGSAPVYDGQVAVLLGGSPTWTETPTPILNRRISWDAIGQDLGTGIPNGTVAAENIFGFTQQADDNLSVIEFIHTYQIPGLR